MIIICTIGVVMWIAGMVGIFFLCISPTKVVSGQTIVEHLTKTSLILSSIFVSGGVVYGLSSIISN